MPKQFVFYDTDVWGNEDYDIRDSEYKDLISICCHYSETLSLIFPTYRDVMPEIMKYEIEKPSNLVTTHLRYDPCQFQVKYFQICNELQEFLTQAVGGIFEWMIWRGFHNPMDPTFFRKDGTVFFESVIHEGECILMPTDQENIDHIISNPLWKTGNDIRKPF